MSTILFLLLLKHGVIVASNDCVNGSPVYSTYTGSTIIELAYREEIIDYIETGTFKYNEDLTFKKDGKNSKKQRE